MHPLCFYTASTSMNLPKFFGTKKPCYHLSKPSFLASVYVGNCWLVGNLEWHSLWSLTRELVVHISIANQVNIRICIKRMDRVLNQVVERWKSARSSVHRHVESAEKVQSSLFIVWKSAQETIWSIWLQRNGRIFNSVYGTVEDVANLAKKFVISERRSTTSTSPRVITLEHSSN